MCQFNLAIVDSDSDNMKIKEAFEQNGLYFSIVKNQNLNKRIESNMKVVFTTKSHCDCGSVIGIDTADNPSKRDVEKEIQKLKRKRWSESKIQRYLDDKTKNELRKRSGRAEENKIELKKWSNTIKDCFENSITKRFGVLTHYFSGTIENEMFETLEIDYCKLSSFNADCLKKLAFDKILLLSKH